MLDDAPDELTQTIGYLESLTDRISIDLITMSTYHVNGAQILVPQRVEPARRTLELSQAEANARQSNALVAGSDDFRATIALAPPNQRELLNRLTDWAEDLQKQHLAILHTYHGKSGMTTLLPRLPGRGGMVTIYTTPTSAYLQFWRTAFENRAPTTLPRVEAICGTPLKQGNITHSVTDELLTALTDAYREANQA